MKALIICPDRRPSAAFLARNQPLALAPFLGRSILTHGLAHLANKGIREVRILACDRPDQIRSDIRYGEKFGLKIDVMTEGRELSTEEAHRKHGPAGSGWLPEGGLVWIADHVPGLPELPLFDNYTVWMETLWKAIPVMGPNQVGARELQPGVWVGLKARIDPAAVLIAPCWIGSHAWVQAGAKVGPETILEDRVMVDRDAEVVRSWIAPNTYVGAMTRVQESMAWGSGLLKWTTESFVEIVDAFLLGSLSASMSAKLKTPWYGRLAAMFALVLTSPLWLIAWANARRKGLPLLHSLRAVQPSAMGASSIRDFSYSKWTSMPGWWSRRPQLWNIVRGEFTWVGNRPIARDQAAQLATEFDQLWLAAPVGLFSLADAEGVQQEFGEEARIHAGYYASQANRHMDRMILARCFARLLGINHMLSDKSKSNDTAKS